VTYWNQNLRLLRKLITEGRNSIWAYMLTNAARPLLMAAQKFDVIAGNPPWLTYKDIRDKGYQNEVRDLTLNIYELLKAGDRKLFTQMEIATLFFVHCQTTYLKQGGTIAFVMPRSVITGAKQHRPFQARGMTHVLDFLEVKPRPFNIESCVPIRTEDDIQTEKVPTTRYKGQMPQKEMSLQDAERHLDVVEGTTHFVGEAEALSPYYDEFKQGATLVPRNLCFVRPQQNLKTGDAAVNPAMVSDPAVNRQAKPPWKDVSLSGLVYSPNLFATLLSKHLVPFG
jgi:hypothetical protein